MGFFRQDPEQVNIKGIELHCEICKNDTFFERETQLHSAVASFFDVEWLGPNARCLICSKCGYIHWFMPT